VQALEELDVLGRAAVAGGFPPLPDCRPGVPAERVIIPGPWIEGVHYWNLLPDGTEIDLTREQFAGNEMVQEPRTVRRPAGCPSAAPSSTWR
jgi:hypothetical protein